MRIKRIALAFFRGAADPVSLELDGKSMVICGLNGSGKSSFVDALEYQLSGGKIGHLAHEYSGKHQERAIVNTHKPADRACGFKIVLDNGAELAVDIGSDGAATQSGPAAAILAGWDYRRTILRQHEVSGFIHDTKGRKYSALLPLLGLHELEMAAENLRQLSKAVEEVTQLVQTKAEVSQVQVQRDAAFGDASIEAILEKLALLHDNYCPDIDLTADHSVLCNTLTSRINDRLGKLSAEEQRHLTLEDIGRVNLAELVHSVRLATDELSQTAEPQAKDRLGVLIAADTFAASLHPGGRVTCPACGQSIQADAFQSHVMAERDRLSGVIDRFHRRRLTLAALSDGIKTLTAQVARLERNDSLDAVADGKLSEQLTVLDSLNAEALRDSCTETELETIERYVIPLIDVCSRAQTATLAHAPQLAGDMQLVGTIKAVIDAEGRARAASSTEAVVEATKALERAVRAQIKLRAQAIIDEISADIQRMWAILHPLQAIQDVRLYTPRGADKAIDIGLKFHGIQQDSPRLTLSEGYRNSLGLCLFLAMASREAPHDRPLFLDDVVVSLDRNHRGMIGDLLTHQFADRQVVVFTHDREWYTELRVQLAGTHWAFNALLPYDDPTLGIRWSHRATTFADARSHIADRPDSAGNDVRKIMDVELALVAERVQLRMPYRRGDANDKRTAHDFMERLIAAARRCFQIKDSTGYVAHEKAIGALQRADRLLVTWANRGSHTFDVVRPEAIKLIEACEQAYDYFKCPDCNKSLWFANAEGAEWVQCQCALIRWRYDKA